MDSDSVSSSDEEDATSSSSDEASVSPPPPTRSATKKLKTSPSLQDSGPETPGQRLIRQSLRTSTPSLPSSAIVGTLKAALKLRRKELTDMSGTELYRFCHSTWPDRNFKGLERKLLLTQALKTLNDATMQQTRMSKAIKKETLENENIQYDDDDQA